MATRSEVFFLELFGAATLYGAAEIAAQKQRAGLLEEYEQVPVDVFRLAAQKGLAVKENLEGAGCQEGLLVPVDGGYRVRLRRASTDTRKRFSLAHELGHTLFYEDAGSGPRHVIGILSKQEHNAEEKICDMFAQCLLMPKRPLKLALERIPANAPGELLNLLEGTSRTFRVSMPALLARLQRVVLPSSPYMVVCSSVRPNASTRQDPMLRVESCVTLGSWRNRFVWWNRSVVGARITGALRTYDAWTQGQERGRFGLSDSGSLERNPRRLLEQAEEVEMSEYKAGKWARRIQPCTSVSSLYTWQSDECTKAYVVTAIAPRD
ncbi:MAG: ImmA/IrrE family metallo-endopeptidase [Acidobacteriia bacterium]|nr:ImmA/IrrE family metallo-endopeptidase [Terriglobia bacterium]